MTEPRTYTTLAGIVWTFHHESAFVYHLGYLGRGLRPNAKVAGQINAAYPFGGWKPFGNGQWKLHDDNRLEYPKDEPMEPIASAKVGEELVCIYRSDWWAIIQPDRSFEVCRLD